MWKCAVPRYNVKRSLIVQTQGKQGLRNEYEQSNRIATWIYIPQCVKFRSMTLFPSFATSLSLFVRLALSFYNPAHRPSENRCPLFRHTRIISTILKHTQARLCFSFAYSHTRSPTFVSLPRRYLSFSLIVHYLSVYNIVVYVITGGGHPLSISLGVHDELDTPPRSSSRYE